MASRTDLLYARCRYRGEIKPENLVFDANLQEFAQRVGYICALESNGKLTPESAFDQLQTLWQELSASKESLGVGLKPFSGS